MEKNGAASNVTDATERCAEATERAAERADLPPPPGARSALGGTTRGAALTEPTVETSTTATLKLALVLRLRWLYCIL